MLFSRALITVLALAATSASPATHAQVYPAKQLRPELLTASESGIPGVEAGIDPLPSSPAEVSEFIKSETAQWAQVISDGKLTVE